MPTGAMATPTIDLKSRGGEYGDGGPASWSPDGSAVVLTRLVGDQPHMFVVELATKKEKDLGPGWVGVWAQS